MQLYDITIAANTTRQLDAPGSYFYYYAGSAGGADSTITLRGLSSGLRLILKPGQAFRLPKGQNETAWVITNYANTATIIGSVLVGDGDVTDNRVTGTVEVIDGTKSRVISNLSFTAAMSVPGVAAQRSKAGIWNPSGSGRRAIVKRIYIASGSTPDQIYISTITAALATTDLSAQNKLVGGSPSANIRRTYESSAGNVGTVNALLLVRDTRTDSYTFDDPWVIPPGYGLTAQSTTDNSMIWAVFEFIDESIT